MQRGGYFASRRQTLGPQWQLCFATSQIEHPCELAADWKGAKPDSGNFSRAVVVDFAFHYAIGQRAALHE